MAAAPLPPDEKTRLKELHEYEILDTPQEEAFDELTKLAAMICGTKISLVSLVDLQRQWFKSRFGLDAEETSRNVSFCAHVILSDEIMVIEDSAEDDRFKDNPLVLGAPFVKFYAGVPLITPTGSRLGSLCVIDTEKKVLTSLQKDMLTSLSKQAVNLMELKLKNRKLSLISNQYSNVQRLSKTGGWELDIATNQTQWSDEIYEIYQIPVGTPMSKIDGISFYAPHERERLANGINRVIDNHESFDGDFEFIDKKGVHKWVRTNAQPVMDKEGKLLKIFGTFQDITDQKKLELQLKEKESKNQIIFDQSVDAILTLSPPTWKFTSANLATLKMFGVNSKEEFCQLGPWNLSPQNQPNGKSSSAMAKEIIDLAMRKGSHFFNWTHARLDGTAFPCTVLLSKIVEGEEVYLHASVRDISQQITAEAQLIEAQAISKVGSWSLNLVTGELFWSLEHYKIFEIDYPQPMDKLYESYRARTHTEDLETLDKLVSRAIEFGEDFTFDHRVNLDHGQRIKYVQGIGKVTKDSSGKPSMLTGTCRDRTRDFELNAKYQNLLESMGEGLVVQDGQGKITQYNPAALSILELSAEELLGRTSQDPRWKAIKITGEEFPGDDHPAMMSIRTGEKVLNVVMGLKYIDQHVKWIRINSIPINNDSINRVITTFSDITEMIEAKEETGFILDAVGLGIWKFNPLTQELTWDKSLYELYGIRPDQFSGDYHAWESSLTPESKDQAVEGLAMALRGEKDLNITFEIKSKDNEKKFLGGKAKVIRNQDGSPSMVYGVNWDQTKEVELEKKLVEEQARSFHNSKLASIGQLAAGVGHEINNPLAIISGNISILQQLVRDPQKELPFILDRMDKMDVAVKRIANIVKGLRTFARSDDSQMSTFDISSLIQETFDMLKDLYRREEVEMTFTGVKTPCTMTGNRGRIQQVFVNLIANAKDATEGRESRLIHIETSYENGALKIIVADNGTGIPDALREKIFTPFFTTKDINKGTGIGLSLVNTIIKEHHGTIEFVTKRNAGTSFIVSLSAKLGEEVKSKPAMTEVESKRKCRVLIVDDEEDLRDILSFIFSKHCSHVSVVPNAREGMKLLEQGDVDLIISDVKMPETDGFKFLQMVRENASIKQPKFMFITGGVEFTTEERTKMRTDTNGVLPKPIEEEMVKKTLASLFPEN